MNGEHDARPAAAVPPNPPRADGGLDEEGGRTFFSCPRSVGAQAACELEQQGGKLCAIIS